MPDQHVGSSSCLYSSTSWFVPILHSRKRVFFPCVCVCVCVSVCVCVCTSVCVCVCVCASPWGYLSYCTSTLSCSTNSSQSTGQSNSVSTHTVSYWLASGRPSAQECYWHTLPECAFHHVYKPHIINTQTLAGGHLTLCSCSISSSFFWCSVANSWLWWISHPEVLTLLSSCAGTTQ